MNNQQLQADVAMETIEMDRVTLMVNRAIEEQYNKYRVSASELSEWHCPSLSKENFWRLLQATAQAIMAQRGVYHRFVVDDDNREVITQMWLYAAGSKDCKWNIHKGIYLGGKVGCGKTLLESLATRPLFIDELGREQLEISDFGNKIRPINDLMALRYNTGARTFFTSNFFLSTLSKGRNEKGEIIGYGQYIGERIQEMTNIVEMPGESRREKWEEERA